MTIELNSTSSATAVAPGSSALTFQHAVNAGDNRCLLIFVECPNSSDLLAGATVTYGGVSLGAAVLNTPANSGALRTYVWRMIAPSVGTANIVITPSAAAYINARAVTFNGVDQSAPITASNAVSQAFATSPQSLSINSGVDGIAVGSCSVRNNTSVITASDGSSPIGSSLSNGVSQMLMAYKAGTSSLVYGFTGSQPLALLSAVALKAVAVSTPVSFAGTVPDQVAVVDTPFSLSLASYFSGSLTPFSYALLSGTLPDGITLAPDTGVISGTPPGIDTSTIVVRATDTGSNTADTNAFTLEVNWAAQVPQGTVTLGTPTGITSSSAAIPYSYSASDQTGFEYRVNGGSPQTVTTSPLVVTGLTASTPYTIEMRAVNATGPQPTWSAPANFTTAAAAQVPQGTFTVGSITTGQTTASVPYTYSAGDATSIQYRLNGGTAQTATASPQQLTGLTANSAYTIEFRAVNAAGPQPTWSAPANFTTQPVPVAQGTLTFNGLVDILNQPWAGATGVTVAVLIDTTDALVVRVTGLTVNGSNTLAVTNASIVAGTTYTCVIRIGEAIGVVRVVAT